MSCKPMAFIMTVLRISLTLSLAFRMPGMKPQNAPARKPMIRVAGSRIQPGQVRNCNENQVVISAPAMICPSPPMLRTLARKAMQMPRPTNSSGVAFTSDCVNPYVLPKTPFTMVA